MIIMFWTGGTGVCYTSGTSTALSVGCACLFVGASVALSMNSVLEGLSQLPASSESKENGFAPPQACLQFASHCTVG